MVIRELGAMFCVPGRVLHSPHFKPNSMNLIKYEEQKLLPATEQDSQQLDRVIQAQKKIDEYHVNKAFTKLAFITLLLLGLLHAATGIAILVIVITRSLSSDG